MNVPAEVEKLKTVLGQLPHLGSYSLGHARTFVAQDETEPLPDVLTFRYREAQFFARVRGTKFYLEPATGGAGAPVIGQGDVNTVTVAEIQGILDPHILPGIVLSEFGDHLTFPAQTQDSVKLTSASLTHGTCGGCVDQRPISTTHFALSCRACHMRVCVPSKVKTLGELRAWSLEMAEALWGHGWRVAKQPRS